MQQKQRLSKTWRGGMIGAGAWSDIQLNAWARVPNAEIVALCDRHPERRDLVAARFNISRVFDDFEAMLDQANLDFVDICTRPYSHAALIRLAAARNVPVLCQKPFCTSLPEGYAVVELCRQTGTRLMVNENFRWQAWYRQAKAVLDTGALGRPFLARQQTRLQITMPAFQHRQAYFMDMPRLLIYEMGTHYLDTFRFLFGDPELIFARMHRISPQVQGEDVLVITMGYPGLTGLIDESWASVPVPGVDKPGESHELPPPPRLEIDGTTGTLILQADGSMHLVGEGGQQQWHFSWEVRPESRIAAQQHFIDCLNSGANFETSGEETLKTMALVYAAYLSAEENRAVDPQELLVTLSPADI